jgi:hypothetical protein
MHLTHNFPLSLQTQACQRQGKCGAHLVDALAQELDSAYSGYASAVIEAEAAPVAEVA